MKRTYIHNARIVNEGQTFDGAIVIENEVIAEVPVIFVNRELGTSKMNSSIFGEAFFGVMQLKWNSWFRKYPQKK